MRTPISWTTMLRRVEPEVGMAGALIGQLADAEHVRRERRAHGVEQVRERPVTRPLPGRAARGPHPSKIGEVGFAPGRQGRCCVGHCICCRMERTAPSGAPLTRFTRKADAHRVSHACAKMSSRDGSRTLRDAQRSASTICGCAYSFDPRRATEPSGRNNRSGSSRRGVNPNPS